MVTQELKSEKALCFYLVVLIYEQIILSKFEQLQTQINQRSDYKTRPIVINKKVLGILFSNSIKTKVFTSLC